VTATPSGDSPATVATGRIDFELFDAKCADKGALDDVARADLVDVDRTTLWRWRNGRQAVSLEAAVRIADRLEVKLDDLLAARDVA
jgi:DNA-binding XRE family transcriptional regulator